MEDYIDTIIESKYQEEELLSNLLEKYDLDFITKEEKLKWVLTHSVNGYDIPDIYEYAGYDIDNYPWELSLDEVIKKAIPEINEDVLDEIIQQRAWEMAEDVEDNFSWEE